MSKCGDFLRRFVVHDVQHSKANLITDDRAKAITNDNELEHITMLIRKCYHRIEHLLIVDTAPGHPNCNDLQNEIFNYLLAIEDYIGKKLDEHSDLVHMLDFVIKTSERLRHLLNGVGRVSDIPNSVFSEYQSRHLISNESILIHTCLVIWYQTLRLIRLLFNPVVSKRDELEAKLNEEPIQTDDGFGMTECNTLTDDIANLDSCLNDSGANLTEPLLMDLVITSWLTYIPLSSYKSYLESSPFICNCSCALFKRLSRRLIHDGRSRVLMNENLLLTFFEIIIQPDSKPSLMMNDIRRFSFIPFSIPSEQAPKEIIAFYVLWFLYSFSTSLTSQEEHRFFATSIINCRKVLIKSQENIMKSFSENLTNQGDYTRLSPHNEERLKMVLIIMMQLASFFEYDISLLGPTMTMFETHWNDIATNYFDPKHFLRSIDSMEKDKDLPVGIKKLSNYLDIESSTNAAVRQRVKYSNYHRDHSIIELFCQMINCYLRTMSSSSNNYVNDNWSYTRNRFCTRFNGDGISRLNEQGFLMSLALLNSFFANANHSRWADVAKHYRDIYEKLDKSSNNGAQQVTDAELNNGSDGLGEYAGISSRKLILVQTLRHLYYQAPLGSEEYFINFVERISDDLDHMVRSNISNESFCQGGTTKLMRSLEPLIGRQRMIEVFSRVEPSSLWTQPSL